MKIFLDHPIVSVSLFQVNCIKLLLKDNDSRKSTNYFSNNDCKKVLILFHRIKRLRDKPSVPAYFLYANYAEFPFSLLVNLR